MMDYELMTDKPMFKVQELVESEHLQTDEIIYSIINMRKHFVKLNDNLL